METLLKPIKNEAEYDIALKNLDSIFHAKPNTKEGDFLEVLSLKIHEYEENNHKIESLKELELLNYEIEERKFSQKPNNMKIR